MAMKKIYACDACIAPAVRAGVVKPLQQQNGVNNTRYHKDVCQLCGNTLEVTLTDYPTQDGSM